MGDIDHDLEESSVAKEWLDWCESHPFVKTIQTDVPEGILPPGFKGSLWDVKVHGTKKWGGPDDKIYANHPELRQKVARGNCVLELHQLDTKGVTIVSTTFHFLVFALRKFSGGMGDEDDEDVSESHNEMNQWQKYFLKPISDAKKVICTEKANGEAAHLSSRVIGGVPFFCLGSKNVHLLARSIDDVSKYTDSRFLVARHVAQSFFDKLSTLEDGGAALANFLQVSKVTGVFELLQPCYQHVIDLSYLQSFALMFICWSAPYSNDVESLCHTSPATAIDQAKEFGLETIKYSIISAEDVESEMEQIRREAGYEGKVLYFLDSEGSVFGVLKKKTAWYIILRCLREKACSLSNPKTILNLDKTEIRRKVVKRIGEIQKWLGFSDEYRTKWEEIGVAFILWAVGVQRKNLKGTIGIRSSFPTLFKAFLETNDRAKTLYSNLEYS